MITITQRLLFKHNKTMFNSKLHHPMFWLLFLGLQNQGSADPAPTVVHERLTPSASPHSQDHNGPWAHRAIIPSSITAARRSSGEHWVFSVNRSQSSWITAGFISSFWTNSEIWKRNAKEAGKARGGWTSD